MKKNISINISGIIFHIEEDGYESLRKYLDSINKYFSSFEDSSEIISDIESRMAEIFLSKLNEGKQVITAEDVNALMVTMGSVTDFKAAEEESTGPTSSTHQEQSKGSSSTKTSESKKLVRDTKRKVLGGVCAGMAHYFNIDPVWPRVLFALLVLGSYGGLIIVYIILWIVLPDSNELDDQPSVKKMYRDQENKVLGGVASGLAAFTGTDTAIIRLLFVIAGFFGFGIILYIVFWIALPEAKTITEKMEMQGEPVTLSNIESSVKKGLNEKDGQEESILAKIILFPFRAIAAVLNAVAKGLGPLFSVIVDVMRIGVGAIITMTGFSLIFTLLFVFGIIAGIFSAAHFPESWNVQFFSPAVVQALTNTVPAWTFTFAFFAAFVPALVIFLLGISTIAKKIVFGQLVGWTLFVLFFTSIVFLSFSVPSFVLSFKEEGEVKVEKTFPLIGKTTQFKIKETGLDDYDVTEITFHGYEGTEIKLLQRFESQGRNRKIAAENARMVEYNVEQQDSVLIFDSNIAFKKDALFRAQRLEMDVYVPFNKPFVIEDALWRLVSNNPRTRHDNQTHTWKFIGSGMQCLTCPDYDPSTADIGASGNFSLDNQYGFRDFNSVEVSGLFTVRIQRGDEFGVDLGTNDKLKERYKVYVDGETLVISYEDNRDFFWNNRFWKDEDEIQIKITLPSLEHLSATGAGKVFFKGFEETDVEIDLTGAVNGEGNINSDNLNIDITGASFLDLKGEGNFLEATITGASGLRAFGYEVENAVVEAHGASTAKVNVTSTLEMTSGMASSITYEGNPEILKRR